MEITKLKLICSLHVILSMLITVEINLHTGCQVCWEIGNYVANLPITLMLSAPSQPNCKLCFEVR